MKIFFILLSFIIYLTDIVNYLKFYIKNHVRENIIIKINNIYRIILVQLHNTN